MVDAFFRLYASASVLVACSSHTMHVTRGIHQGCPAPGALWALLYDPVVRRVWQSFLFGDGILALFADDSAVVLRNVFRDWRRVRNAFRELRL